MFRFLRPDADHDNRPLSGIHGSATKTTPRDSLDLVQVSVMM